ncbi:uncharacterized protein LOC118438465 [Folsomia candida]|uniref:uncharacterized protein LOC118438465 n=1 Tax=Folsomia candida TaxID=158441 RepID=UPI001604E22B|nr:uncharacterized protein LOC118438465 [Folsomia candida]
MGVDNVTFLIMWFMVMFVTLSSGILVIMYRVGCFKCDRKIGVADLPTSLQKLIRPQQSQQQQKQGEQERDAEAATADGIRLEDMSPRDQQSHPHNNQPHSSSSARTVGPAPRILLQRQHTDRSEGSSGGGRGVGPNKVCTVCGEPLGPEEETTDNSHPSCRDMDASFF